MSNDGWYRLTGNQRDVWAGHTLAPHSPRYNTGGYVRIDGPFDIDLFEQAARAVVAGTDALRIRIELVDEEPWQSFPERIDFQIERLDFTGEKDPDQAAQDHICQEFQRPFDIYTGPLFYYALLTVAEDRHYWLMKYHHVANDGWGILQTAKRLAETYNALARGKPLPDWSEYSFRSAIEEDQRYRASARFDKDGQSWEEVFSEIPPLAILSQHDAALDGDPPGAILETIEIDRDRAAALAALGANCGASFNHILIAVLYTYFTRVLDSDELVIGSAAHNRRTQQAKNTVGMYVGFPPLRLSFGKALLFTELIDRVRGAVYANLRRQRHSLGDIARRIGLLRTGRQKLFDIGLSFLALKADIDFDGSPAHIMRAPLDDEVNPLEILVQDYHADKALLVELRCSLAVFNKEEARLLRDRLDRLFSTVLEHPTRSVATIPIEAPGERQRILTEFSGGTLTVAKGETLVDGFERQAAASPHAPALVTEDGETVCYRDLNVRADRLAGYLRHRGIGREDLVAVIEERTPSLVVTILAILKAGGAYLPIEPTTPLQRVGEILSASDAGMLLTRDPVLDAGARAALTNAAAAAGWSRDVVLLDKLDADLLPEPGGEIVGRPGPDDPAYVIYTSGSTGAPKGVVVTHHNVVRLFTTTAEWFAFGTEDVLSLCHSYAFDFSVWEIWGALLHGASLVIVSQETTRSPDAMVGLISERGVTVLNQTPSAFSALMQSNSARDGRLPGMLRVVVFGGEPLQPGAVAEWFECFGDEQVRLVNMYGITETTVHVTGQLLDRESLKQCPDSVGVPIADLTVHILDEDGQVAPFGVPGEIHVGGAGVTRGYLRQPELTRQRFIPDPFSTEPGAVLYKTGDVGILEPDGRIRHRGRVDRQLQLRGHRVEPGEIESCLLSLPEVAGAAVVARELGPGDVRLTAFVVGSEGTTLEPDQLREQLRQRLPAYMLPGVIQPIAAMPLTASGKTDWKQLAEIERDDTLRSLEFAAPVTRLERDIAAIWSDVLKIPQVGRDDNFFDLGGHSLLSMKVREAVERLLNRKVSITRLFSWPTVRTMAAGLARSDGSDPDATGKRGRGRAEQRRRARAQRSSRGGSGDSEARRDRQPGTPIS